MKNILIINSQSFGDALLGTHLAKLIKAPDTHISFAVRVNITLTTRENDSQALDDMLEIFSLQEGIDSVGVIQGNSFIHKKGIPSNAIRFDKVYSQSEWFSDAGIAASMLIPFYDESGWPDKIKKVETSFNVGKSKNCPEDKINIAIPGKIDWIRKIGYYPKNVIKYINSLKDIELVYLEQDTFKTYLQALQALNDCHLFVGPMGSLTHAAAGLNVSTISLCSVFPAHYDSPEFYHSGFHSSLTAPKSLHCGDYKCVSEKKITERGKSWGNPPTLWNFWVKTCPYTANDKSCVANIQEEDIISEIQKWLNNAR